VSLWSGREIGRLETYFQGNCAAELDKKGKEIATRAIIMTDMFRDSEYSKPAEAFQQAGHGLVHVGLKADDLLKNFRLCLSGRISLIKRIQYSAH
jgi:hypothetical protein